MFENRVGLIGARSFVGERLNLLMDKKGYQVISFSRQGGAGKVSLQAPADKELEPIKNWICLAPIWTLPQHLHLLEKYEVRRLVALSSTSRFTKILSNSPSERFVASQLQKGEDKVLEWATINDCKAIILQPTLIYGGGKDKNITQIAKFILRFGFFPLLGKGEGLRQPVHVDDVANACLSALETSSVKQSNYILSGAEPIPYRVMVERIFVAMGKKPRFIHCPLLFFSITVRLANFLSMKGVTTDMAVRMNRNQGFDHREAAIDLSFRPRPFSPQRSDCINPA